MTKKDYAMRLCNEALYEGGCLVAFCGQPYGVEHAHSDHSASELVAAGLAEPIPDGDYSVTISVWRGEVTDMRRSERAAS